MALESAVSGTGGSGADRAVVVLMCGFTGTGGLVDEFIGSLIADLNSLKNCSEMRGSIG